MNKAIFLDRDGIININRNDYVKSWEEFEFSPDIFEFLRFISLSDYLIIIITNQSAVGRGLLSSKELLNIHSNMFKELENNGGRIDALFFCTHTPEDNCDCRKPKPGLLLSASEFFDIDLSQSIFIGDSESDIEAAKAAGVFPILLKRR